VVVDDIRLGLEVLHAGGEGGELLLEGSLFGRVWAGEAHRTLLRVVGGDLGAKGGIEPRVVRLREVLDEG
jgi:hypothetical protein